jgi:hypothetical protein
MSEQEKAVPELGEIDNDSAHDGTVIDSGSEKATPVDAFPFARVLGDFQRHFDKTIQQFKEDTVSKFSKASQEVNKLRENSEVSFKFKGNKVQYIFNCEISEQILAAREGGRIPKDSDKILEGILDQIRHRNKLIRFADKSDAGWSAVDEYEVDEVADDSDDEKKMRAAQARALKKRKAKAPKKSIYKRGSANTFPNPNSHHDPGNYNQFFRGSVSVEILGRP